MQNITVIDKITLEKVNIESNIIKIDKASIKRWSHMFEQLKAYL